MQKKPSLFLFLHGIVFLIFFQLLTTLIEATYTFGLLSVDIPPEIIFAGFLLTPLVFLALPSWLDHKHGLQTALAAGILAILCWGLSLFLDTRGQMISAGIGTGAMLICLPALIRRPVSPQPALTLTAGLAFGVFVTILLRIENYGSGELPGERGLITIAGFLALGLLEFNNWNRVEVETSSEPSPDQISFGRVALACLGLSSVLVLIYFGFSSPVIMARWAGSQYEPLLGLSAAALGGLLVLVFIVPSLVSRLPRPVLVIWNGLFGLALAGALLAHQIPFPANPSAYPLAEPPVSPLALPALYLAILLHPILYLDFAILAGSFYQAQVSSRRLAGGLALAAVFQLVIIFGHVFTTVYDYIPVVGPLFRDRFWLMYAVPAFLVFCAVLFTKNRFSALPELSQRRWPLVSTILFTSLALAASAIQPQPIPSGSPAGMLKVMTYNIQQGYRADGQKGYREQLDAIRTYNPDILGLQESDTARIANGNHDLVSFLAHNLGMHVYYGPKIVTGTFGIALLSRYPIEDPRTFYLYSQGEQTAVIVAKIRAGDQLYHVMVTHLGNGGPLIQQQQVLELVEGQSNVILMGDFNFRPATEQYQLTMTLLTDGWQDAPSTEIVPTGLDPDRRIDHIFLSPNLRSDRAVYFGEGPSDHPGLVMEVWSEE